MIKYQNLCIIELSIFYGVKDLTDFLLKAFVKNYKDVKNAGVRAAYGKVSGFVGIVCNALLFVLKIIIGTLSGSVSITADAFNNLSDASSSVISLLGFKMSEKPADAEHPYGHGRYEYLSGLTVAVLIIVIGVELLKTSVGKIINPTSVNFSIALVVILLSSVVVKLWMMVFNRKVGKRISSKTLLATADDSRNDVISTLAVLLGAVISHFTSLELDGIIGFIVAVFILVSGFGLIKDTVDPMLGSAPDHEFIKYVRDKIMSYDAVIGTHDLIVHDYGPSRKFASVHVEMAAEHDPIDCHDIIDNIENDFKVNDELNLIVHYDPVLVNDPLTNELKSYVMEKVAQINKDLTIHDFRVVPGNTHTNLVFDCVAHFNLKMTDFELKSEIEKKIKAERPECNCVITIDRTTEVAL